ncbi:MAG TPA: cellulase family glycosylhydrolase [Gaiellaceae bacterium]
MVRSLVLAALVVGIAAAAPSTATDRPTPGVAPSRVGIADGGDVQTLAPRDRGRYLDGIRGAGARWIRVGLYWAVVQRGGRTSYDWKAFDAVVKAARRRGLNVLGTLLYTPAWARPAGTRANSPPTDPTDFGTFAGRAASHFRARGVQAYEIWNEPNIAAFWAPGPDPARYTELLAQAYRAIKRADPSATVVSGGLSPYAGYGVADAQHMNPLTFLEQMYANGARKSMDAVGWHPYSFPSGLRYHPWSSWSQMAQTRPSARSIMRANGDAAKKISATEWGAPTGASPVSMTEEAQAQLVTDALTRLKAWRWTGPSFLYTFRDKGTNAADRDDNFGLVRHDWSAKPAYEAFRRVAAARP